MRPLSVSLGAPVMASKNHISLMVANHRKNLIIVASLIVISALLVTLFFVLHHSKPEFPIMNITAFSATPFADTTTATWNTTISISNPNRDLPIFSKQIYIVAFYLYHNTTTTTSNDYLVLGGSTIVDESLTLSKRAHYIFFPVISIPSARNIGSIGDNILSNQARGKIEVGFSISFTSNFKNDKIWTTYGFSCIVDILFDERTSFGIIPNLPLKFQYGDMVWT